MAVSLLDREIYSCSDVDRLVGLRSGTSKRWLNGYRRANVSYEPILRPDPHEDDVVTWGEMVEARLLAEFRDKNVPVQSMRPAIARLRAEFGPYPLAHAQPFLDVAGRELVMRVQNEVSLAKPMQLVVVRNGQLILSDAVDRFRASVEYDDGAAVSFAPQSRTPSIRMDPARAFGQPAISGRALRTSVLAEDYRAGATPLELSELYDLLPEQVDEALRFELIVNSNSAA